MGIERAHLVRSAGFQNTKELGDAADREFDNIAAQAEPREMRQVTKLPHDYEGRTGERVSFWDVNGEIGDVDQKYILRKFPDGWYRQTALVKVR